MKIKKMRLSLMFGCLLLLVSCARNNLETFDFLVGHWKVEGKEQYEVWQKKGHHELKGHSYGIIDGREKILEFIAIRMNGDNVIYEATVPEQNEGKTIQFKLNPDIRPAYSFENPDHDFPKKIQYMRKSDHEMEITVTGDEGEGFSYTLIRQETN